jgi:hypothetical protein
MELDVQFQNTIEITGQDFRHGYERPLGEGVEGYSDLLVAPGASATTVDISSGIGFVRGDGLTDLGLYRCRNDATKNSAAFEAGGLAAPDATNPRLDQIIARVYDDDVDSEGQHKWRLAVLKGTPKTGDTLDKREGAAALPNSAMLLADVLVPAGAPAVLKAEAIRDRRPFCYPIVPPLLTDVDMVPFLPLGGGFDDSTLLHATADLHQGATAVVLPRRIVAGTKLRWAYEQANAVAMTGNYVIALFDASGRKIVDTGSVAFTGATNSRQVRSETIAATTLEAGIYYAFFGIDSAAGEIRGVRSYSPPTMLPGMSLAANTGGVTVPASILGLTDSVTTGGAFDVPALAISVG